MTTAGAFGWCVAAWGLAHGLVFLAELMRVWQADPCAAELGMATRGMVSGGCLAAVGWGLWRIYCPRDSLQEVAALHWPHWIWLAVSGALAVFLHCGLDAAFEWYTAAARLSFELKEVAEVSHPRFVGVAALGVCLFSPAAEEFFFRGVLIGRMGGASVARVGVTALLFAMMHNKPLAWPSLFAVGLILGILRIASRSLVPALILHCIFNTMILAGNPLTLRLEPTMSEGQRVALSVASVAFLLTLSYWASRTFSASSPRVSRR